MFCLHLEILSSSPLPNSPTPSSPISTVVYIGALVVTSEINELSTTTITIPVSTIPFPNENENNEIHGIYTKIIIVIR